MKLVLLATAFAFSLPLFAEPLKTEKLIEDLELFNEAGKLRDAGKTVKAERAKAVAEATLEKHVRPGIKMSFPEACTFQYNASSKEDLSMTCVVAGGFTNGHFSRIKLIAETDDAIILEKLQDCDDSCTGDFYIVQHRTNEIQTHYPVHGSVWVLELRIKFINVNQVKKASEAQGKKTDAPAQPD